MTARKPPSESYAEREARVLREFRLKVIADPGSHGEHADEAERLLSAPRFEDVVPYVKTLGVDQLIALRAALQGRPIPGSVEAVVFRMVEWDDDDEPDEVPELAPDTEPAIDEDPPAPVVEAEPYSQTLPIKRTIKYPHSV